MSESFVVRLVSSSLEAGELTGEVEMVATGRHALFRSADELLVLLRSGAAGPETNPPDEAGRGSSESTR